MGDVASRQKLETAEAAARKSDAAVAGTRAALAAARGQLAVLEAQRKQQEAKLGQAEAQRDLARNDLDNTVIRAPVDGVVGNKGVQLGQYVKTGTQLLAVVPLPEIYVVANFKETQLRRMMPGQRAEVTIDAFPDAPIEGRIESVSPGSGSQWSILPPDNATGNFTKIVQRVPVRIALPSGNSLASRLRPGLSVAVAVTTSETAKGEAIANGAIWGALQPQQASLR
jgi:membrane fusion protein (multidrug efflux system)